MNLKCGFEFKFLVILFSTLSFDKCYSKRETKVWLNTY